MASGFKKFLGTALPILGVATGNPLLAAAGGAAGGAMTGGAKGALWGGATAGAGSFLGNKFLGGQTGQNPLSGLLGSFGKSTSPVMNPLGPSGGGMPPSNYNPLASFANRQTSSQGGMFGGLTNKLQSNPLATGLGLMGASQFFKSPRVPEIPQSIIDFQNQAKQGSSLGNLAQQRLTEQLNTPMQQVSDAEIQAAVRQLEQDQQNELHRLTGVYKSLRPGTDITTDSSYAKDTAELNDRYARAKADVTTNLRRQVQNDFQSQRAQQILAANGIDAQRLSQMAQAGQVDLDMVLSQFQVDDRDKQAIRNLLLQSGANIVGSQLDPNAAINNQNSLLQNQLFQMMLQRMSNP